MARRSLWMQQDWDASRIGTALHINGIITNKPDIGSGNDSTTL
jgi:hypothetical protein